MNHDDSHLDERLTAYAMGETDAAESARIEALIARDPEAAAHVELLRATAAHLRDHLDDEAHASLSADRSHALREEAQRAAASSAKPWASFRGLAAAAVALLMAGVATTAWLNRPVQDRADEIGTTGSAAIEGEVEPDEVLRLAHIDADQRARRWLDGEPIQLGDEEIRSALHGALQRGELTPEEAQKRVGPRMQLDRRLAGLDTVELDSSVVAQLKSLGYSLDGVSDGPGAPDEESQALTHEELGRLMALGYVSAEVGEQRIQQLRELGYLEDDPSDGRAAPNASGGATTPTAKPQAQPGRGTNSKGMHAQFPHPSGLGGVSVSAGQPGAASGSSTALDSNVWKTQNPSSRDWFGVAHGAPAVGGTSAAMSNKAGDWGVPLTFHDTADVDAFMFNSGFDNLGGGQSDTGGHPGLFFNDTKDGDLRARTESLFGEELKDLHAAAQWPSGDSNTWLGSDTDGPDTDGTPAAPTIDVEAQVRAILDALAAQPGETPSAMFFRYWGDNAFEEVALDARSTFGLDVDTASYTLARRYLTNGIVPPAAAIRTEEFLNAFDHGLAPPTDGSTFAIYTEVGPSLFGADGTRLLKVGLKAREVALEDRPPVSLTFIIDVSGSMDQENRLGLVKQSLHLLVDQLTPEDTIGLVTFSDEAKVVLAPHSLEHRAVIRAAIDGLTSGGSTNAGEGLLEGYKMALAQFRDEAQNRVMLCSDGVANTGITDLDGMLQQIAKYREGEIYLHTVGVGMGNHNDTLLEQLADRGDGHCTYVDRLEEARRVFVDDLTGTLVTVASDAKLQVVFDPAKVVRYRLLGYENRAVADRDFRNDAVDAGELGAGHEVVALYELEVAGDVTEGDKLAKVRLRYRDVDADEVVETSAPAVDTGVNAFEQTSRDFRLCTVVAECAEVFRQSIHVRHGSLGRVRAEATALLDQQPDHAELTEFVALVRQALRIPDLIAPPSEWARTIDAVKRNRILQHRVAKLEEAEATEMLAELESSNQKLEERLRTLLERRR